MSPVQRSLGIPLGLGAAAVAARLATYARAADFTGKVGLVTGGSRGLGLLIARELGAQGCKVAICSRDDDELIRARRDLEERGVDTFTVVCDVADRGQVDGMVAEVVAHFGRIDVLVNDAGVIQVGPLEAMEVSDFEQAMNIMFWGPLYTTLAVLPAMRDRGAGWIVNITSIGGKIAAPHLLPYECAKFAAVGLSEGLRAELARAGVSVTTVCPGLMRTGSQINALFKGNQQQEYALFAPGASLPLVSIDAERAARQVVAATRRGQAELVVGVAAAAAVRAHGLFPGITANVLGLVAGVLPGASGPTDAEPGKEATPEKPSPIWRAMTAFGRSASRRFNQVQSGPES